MSLAGIDFEDPILGFDLGSTTGWGCLEGNVYRAGEQHFRKETRLSDLRKWVYEIVEATRPALIAIEQPFINLRPSTMAILHMHGVVLERLQGCMAPHIMIGNTEAKRHIGGHGGMTAEDKKNGAMVRALSKLGFVVSSTDAADGLAVALCARRRIFGRLT